MYKEKSVTPNNCDAFLLLKIPYAQTSIFVHLISLQTPISELSLCHSSSNADGLIL